MAVTIYPTLQEALHLHARLLQRYGGGGGVRDMGLLESALMRPRSGYYVTLPEQAAALLDSLARHQPFVDGNKRVAFAMCAVFLRLNGYRLVVSADDAEDFLIKRIIEGHAEISESSAWLQEHMVPLG